MPIAAASRFALLPDDDNTDFVAPKSKAEKKKEKEKQKQKEEADKAKALAKKKNSEANALRSLAFGGPKTKKKNQKKKNGSANANNSIASSEGATSEKAATPEGFEDWKEKDKKQVDNQYQEDLTNALLASKVSAEAEMTSKETSGGLPGFPDFNPELRSGQIGIPGKKPAAQGSGGGGKAATLSLEEFNSLSSNQVHQISRGLPPNLALASQGENNKVPVVTDDFFDKVNEDALKLMRREQRLEELKRGPVGPPPGQNPNPGESLNPDDSLTESPNPHASPRNPKIELTMKEVENGLLRRENANLKEKVEKLSAKVKDLVSILSDTETREKTELAVALRKTTKIKDEYAEEIKRLHKECEQERTKSHELAKELRRVQSGGNKSANNSTSIS